MNKVAPLVSIPEAPAPRNGGAEWVEAVDGAKLRVALFRPDGAPRGSVILSPGRTEPIEKYVEVIGELRDRGFVVLVHDWRGQGLSARALPDRLMGHARGWRLFLADYNQLLEDFAGRLPKPWIAMGHSMGGGLTALAIAEGEDRFAAAVLSAPMLGVNTGARKLAAVHRLSFLMNLVGKAKTLVAPEADPLDDTFDKNVLTHDRARWERTRAQVLAEPDLRLGGITWGWLSFALTLSQRVIASRLIDKLPIPLTIVVAGEEKLVINAAAEAVAKRAPKGRYVEVKGAYHEILMETDARRAVFWKAFDAVADEVAPGATPKPKAAAKPKAVPEPKAVAKTAAKPKVQAVVAAKPAKKPAKKAAPKRPPAKAKPKPR